VTIDAKGSVDPAGYDVVHLFNFALPQLLREQGERAHRAGVPFVVTTLCEDVSTFHNQSWSHAKALTQFVGQGQKPELWNDLKDSWKHATPSARFENDWVVRNAAVLMTNGEQESAILRREYPGVGNLQVVHLGHEIDAKGSAEEFERAHGVRDFVLCVGRIETRKNQLMLLKALEESELTVVLAAGGFTYQPEYDRAVRNFKRRGKTIILDKLTPEMLSSAYQACRVHALPSWFELPGLVSLEAAAYGKNVVVTDRGTTRDYLQSTAFYCEPHDSDSIRNAVCAGFYSPAQADTKRMVSQFTWERTVDETILSYAKCVQVRSVASPTVATPVSTMPSAPIDVAAQIERAEAIAREGKLEEAEAQLMETAAHSPYNPWLLRTQGAIALAQRKVSEARSFFTKAGNCGGDDQRISTGLGMCDMVEEQWESAHDRFYQVVSREPTQTLALRQLVDCAYRIGRFELLEQALARYVAMKPTELEWQYCHAGALFKLGRYDDAERCTRQIVQANPTHQPARDLLTEIVTRRPQPRMVAAPVTAPAPVRPPDSATAVRFDGVDQRLVELEEAKRARKYDEVAEGSREILGRSGLLPDQREKARILQAEISILQGRVAEAKPMYDEILQANPRSARAMCGRATLIASDGRWGDAEKIFKEASLVSPQYDLPFTGLGMCAATQGRREEAWDLYMTALKINSENTRALLGLIELGYALQRVGQLEGPLKEYLDLHPADLDFVYAFAGCLFAQGKVAEAKGEIDKLMIFDPGHKHANELRQMIQEREGAPSRNAWNG
jgi:tetratricopeptide (TPR) repeat protein